MKDAYTLRDYQIAILAGYLVATIIQVVIHLILSSFPSMTTTIIHIAAGIAVLSACMIKEQ